MHISKFIEYTFELFPNLKNTVGDKAKGKDKSYSLTDSQALSVYIRKYNKGSNPVFTQCNVNFFINKCRYFIYPEQREKIYINSSGKVMDISVDEFSDRCINLFFLHFGINFSFLRIEKDDNTKFAHQQKKFLEDLFYQTVSLFKRDKTEKSHKSEIIFLLKLLFVKYRYILFSVDKERLQKFNPYLNDEVKNLITYTALHSFHLGKPAFYIINEDGTFSVEEQDEEILSSFRNKNFSDIDMLMQRIYGILLSEKKEDIVRHMKADDYNYLEYIQNCEIEINNSYSVSKYKIECIENLIKESKTRIFINLAISDYITLFHQYADSEHKKFSDLRWDWYCDVLSGVIDYNIMNSKKFAKFCLNIFMINMYATIREIQLRKILKLE